MTHRHITNTHNSESNITERYLSRLTVQEVSKQMYPNAKEGKAQNHEF